MSEDILDNEEVIDEVTSVDDATSSSAAPDDVDPRSEVERERDEYLDTLRRLQADFENYRKRVTKSTDDAATRAAGDIIAKLLPVLDAFDLARHHLGASEGEIDAVEQARSLMLDALQREGLERIDAVDVAFDPQVHDAVAHDDREVEGGPVVEDVLRAGYLWKGAVLRPAMVKVSG